MTMMIPLGGKKVVPSMHGWGNTTSTIHERNYTTKPLDFSEAKISYVYTQIHKGKESDNYYASLTQYWCQPIQHTMKHLDFLATLNPKSDVHVRSWAITLRGEPLAIFENDWSINEMKKMLEWHLNVNTTPSSRD